MFVERPSHSGAPHEFLRGWVRGLLRGGVAGLALCAANPVFAHDFWIEPSALHAPVDSAVKLQLKVGHGEDVVVLPRNPERFEKFVVAGPSGTADIVGVDGNVPAGIVRPSMPGLYQVAYLSRYSTVDLDAVRFEAYLREEGLERVSKLRADRGLSHTRGRERYSRCAKAILTIGDGPHKGVDKPVGMRLELLAEKSPRDIRAGAPTSFRLLFEGAPIAGVLVRASTLEVSDVRLEARTDASGRVAFTLDRAGVWRLNAVHMLELAAGDATVQASSAGTVVGDEPAKQDWESLWASLVFAVPPAAPGAVTPPTTGTPPAEAPAAIDDAQPAGPVPGPATDSAPASAPRSGAT
ncbi:MAG: DUF4198 domain-containing protein [Phycisphaerae bacterium]|nr:DUF4198 domain-containing protein [Phycisphaerae bacterium]